MAEQPDTPKILNEISKSNSARTKTPASRKQQNARRRFIIVVIFFLPVLSGIVFLAYQQVQLRKELLAFQQEGQNLTQALAAQEARMQQLQQQLADPLQLVPIENGSAQQREADLNQELLAIRQQLTELQNRPAVVETEPDLQWKLLEAEYLLGLASKKLQLERDRVSALALMQLADSALLESGNVNVFAIRQVISRESAQLQAVQITDQGGLYLRIGNVAMRAQSISLFSSMRENFENRRNTELTSEEIGAAGGGFVSATLSFLRSVFVWREWERIPEAMLASGQDVYIKQNLQLMLEQARVAVVSRDQTLYRTSLTNAGNWLQRYAVIDTEIGQTILAEISDLAGIDLNPSLPLPNESLSLLKGLIVSGQ